MKNGDIKELMFTTGLVANPWYMPARRYGASSWHGFRNNAVVD